MRKVSAWLQRSKVSAAVGLLLAGVACGWTASRFCTAPQCNLVQVGQVAAAVLQENGYQVQSQFNTPVGGALLGASPDGFSFHLMWCSCEHGQCTLVSQPEPHGRLPSPSESKVLSSISRALSSAPGRVLVMSITCVRSRQPSWLTRRCSRPAAGGVGGLAAQSRAAGLLNGSLVSQKECSANVLAYVGVLVRASLFAVALAGCGRSPIAPDESNIGRSDRPLSDFSSFVVRSDMSDQDLERDVRASLVAALTAKGLRQDHLVGSIPSSTLVVTFTDGIPAGDPAEQQAGNTATSERHISLRIDTSTGAMFLDATLRATRLDVDHWSVSVDQWHAAVLQQLTAAWAQL